MIDLNEVIELDRLNMTPVIEASGGSFDPERRRAGLSMEIERGCTFFTNRRDGVMLGYLQYELEPGDVWHILSIQIHPAHQRGLVLRGLLSQVYNRLIEHPPAALRTSVHITNSASIQLHHGLGFTESGRERDRILFRVEGSYLCERLQRFTERS